MPKTDGGTNDSVEIAGVTVGCGERRGGSSKGSLGPLVAISAGVPAASRGVVMSMVDL